LYSITEFKDFDEDEWRAARYLIDYQRAKKKRAEHGNNRQKHHSIN
jgi:hypothetical protein